MRSLLIAIRNFLADRVVLLLRLAGVVAIASGLIGGYVWFVDLADRSDGDDLRWGFWHNPFMQFRPFDEAFLENSMWVLFACSAAAGLGGLMLLVPVKWGVPLVTWQARVSIAVNGVIVVAMMWIYADYHWHEWHVGGPSRALLLRLGSIAVDLTLWTFLSSQAVREFFGRHAHTPERGFDVIVKESGGSG